MESAAFKYGRMMQQQFALDISPRNPPLLPNEVQEMACKCFDSLENQAAFCAGWSIQAKINQ